MAFRPSETIKERVETALDGFFDIINKGRSGLASAVGVDKNKELVRECFLRVKLSKSLIYGIYYVGLTRDNTLYICKKMYDPPHAAAYTARLGMAGSAPRRT